MSMNNKWRVKYLKWILLGVPLGIIALIIYTAFKPKEVSDLPTILEREELPETKVGETLILLDSNPPSGDNDPKTSPFIRLKFNKEVSPETVRYIIYPNIEVAIEVYEQEKDTLIIFPKDRPWSNNTRYEFTISYLEGKDGAQLKAPIKYSYFFKLPDILPSGESGMVPQ